jgi:hypothetical protein
LLRGSNVVLQAVSVPRGFANATVAMAQRMPSTVTRDVQTVSMRPALSTSSSATMASPFAGAAG